MSETQKTKSSGSGLILSLGVLLTVGFMLFVLFVGFAEQCQVRFVQPECKSNFQRFWDSPPNEKGDALAGIAGSLAFLWLIVTVLLQWRELALQRAEMERMGETQEAQTDLLLQQARRDEAAVVDAKIEEMVKVLVLTLPDLAFPHFRVEYPKETGRAVNSVAFVKNANYLIEELESTIFWAEKIEQVRIAVVEHLKANGGHVTSPSIPTAWIAVHSQCAPILDECSKGSPRIQEWVLHTLKISFLKRSLQEAINETSIWAT